MDTQNRPSRLLALIAILLLLTPILAACGANAPAQSTAVATAAADTTEPTPAPTLAAGPAATEEPTVVAETPQVGPTEGPQALATETGPEPTPVGEQLDLAALSPDIPDPSSPVTITFQSWVSEGLKPFKQRFEKLHPNIKIKLQDVPAEQMQDKLTTQLAGGNAPDAAFVDNGTVGAFATRNALVNLNTYIPKSKAVKPDDYVDAFRRAVTVKNNMYGLPFDGESTGLFYRTDLFQQAGIAGPPKTWEEFEAAAKKLTNKEKRQYGFAVFATEAVYYWYPWLWQTGERAMTPDGKVTFNSERGKRAAEFYVKLAREYSPPDLYNSNSWDGRVAFANGKVGMYMAGAWFAGELLNSYPKIKGKWAAAPLPRDQQCATTIAGDSLIIFNQSKNKDAAWKWIEFLSAPQNLALWNVGTRKNPSTLLPPRQSLIEDPQIFANNPILKDFAQMMNECGVTDPAYEHPKWGDVEWGPLNEQLGKAIYGEVDAATALDESALEAEDILKEE